LLRASNHALQSKWVPRRSQRKFQIADVVSARKADDDYGGNGQAETKNRHRSFTQRICELHVSIMQSPGICLFSVERFLCGSTIVFDFSQLSLWCWRTYSDHIISRQRPPDRLQLELTDRLVTAFSTFINTRGLMRICPG
jgi:hypothetical protein